MICVPKSFQVLLMLQQFENHCSVPLHILLASGCLVAVTSWGQPLLVGSDKPAHLKLDSDFLPTCLAPHASSSLLYPKGTERVWDSFQCLGIGNLKVCGNSQLPSGYIFGQMRDRNWEIYSGHFLPLDRLF